MFVFEVSEEEFRSWSIRVAGLYPARIFTHVVTVLCFSAQVAAMQCADPPIQGALLDVQVTFEVRVGQFVCLGVQPLRVLMTRIFSLSRHTVMSWYSD
jgi:hypothetical protein